MDKKRTRELARIEWQKEKEAKRRARGLEKKPPEKPATSDPVLLEEEAGRPGAREQR